jgi:signal transduction histidine kinase
VRQRRIRHPARLLLPLLAITIASFGASTWIAQRQAAGVGSMARSIAVNALPSVDVLSDLRTRLRHLAIRLDDSVDVMPRGRQLERSMEETLRQVSEVKEQWRKYTRLEAYPGENELRPLVRASLNEVSSSADAIVRSLHRGDARAAKAVLDAHLKPAVDRADDGLVAMIDLNARMAAAITAQIAEIGRTARRWAILLDLVSAVLTLVVGVITIQIVRRASQEMERQIDDLSDFAGRVAHDIRSPLASVGLALERTQREPGLASGTRDLLGRATRTVHRVGQLTDGLLTFALAGAPPGERNRASLRDAVEGVLDGLLPACQEKGIELRAEGLPPTEVACSPGVLASILSNLVVNAIKYLGDSPLRRIEIRAAELGRMTRLEVADTGPGVPHELQGHIFRPFVRAAEAGTSGLGLGLATVRRLVEAHGGSVGVRSGEETGSVFWFTLPSARSRARRSRL